MNRIASLKLGILLLFASIIMLLLEIFLPFGKINHTFLGAQVALSSLYLSYLLFRYEIGTVTGGTPALPIVAAIFYLPVLTGVTFGEQEQKLLDTGVLLFFIVSIVLIVEKIRSTRV
jgi:hypothetical protein